jgi:hypothetical protein
MCWHLILVNVRVLSPVCRGVSPGGKNYAEQRGRTTRPENIAFGIMPEKKDEPIERSCV